MLLPLLANGQAISNEGQQRGIQKVLGAAKIDSILFLPVRPLTAWAYASSMIPYIAGVQVSPTDTLPYYIKKSGSYVRFLFLSDTGLFITINDTSALLGPYLRKADTVTLSNRINLKLNISDTLTMLAAYLRKTDTVSLSNRINAKLSTSDSAAMLANYVRNVVLNTPSVLYATPINFSISSHTATGTLSLNNQNPRTFLAGATTGTTTPTFRGIDATDLPAAGTPGTYGSSSLVPVITTDAYGRVTTVTTAAITSGGGETWTPVTHPSNSNYTITAGNQYVTLSGALTATRTLTLPVGVTNQKLILITYATSNGWLVTPTYIGVAGTNVGSIPNQTIVKLWYNGTNWQIW